MPEQTRDELRPYYQQELTYLRERGAAFARRFPKIAQRLQLGHDEIPDPHVERLMEAFAFLTARLQYNIENEFPEIPTALLGLVYPQFTCPIPSMAIARFVADPAEANLNSGFTVDKHTELFAENPLERTSGMLVESPEGLVCRFRTCYPTTLWPLAVEEARLESTDEYEFLGSRPDVVRVLRIRLGTAMESLADLGSISLRFFLNGYRPTVHELYELLCGALKGVAIRGEGSPPRILGQGGVRPVGFADDEDVLPYPRNAHPAYRLVQEYVCFPEKFLFVDVDGIEVPAEGRSFDLLFLLDDAPRGQLRVDRDTFCLGCTPIINLFSKTSEPLRLNQTSHEYRLVADLHRERTTEIHSIRKVSAVSDYATETKTVAPFFSYDHAMTESGQRAFWHARREETGRADLPGTDMYISFLDLDFNPALPPHDTVYAHLLCTNRDLARQLPEGAGFDVEEAVPVLRDESRPGIYALTKPTFQLSPPLDGPTYWRLTSHLALNYISLTEGEESLKALREFIKLYSYIDLRSVEQAAHGIRDMSARQVVRRIGDEAWRGFCRGVEVTLTFDESLYAGSSAYLLASVLNHFLALHAPVNGFTELVIKSTNRKGIWTRWPPMAGAQPLL